MNDFKAHVVSSFIEYVDLIKKLKTQDSNLWFRGQCNASYRLIPSAMRTMWEISDYYDRPIKPRKVENKFHNRRTHVAYLNQYAMLEEFKILVKDYLRLIPENDLEWLSIAQHYGIPTTLLDWTTDPLVALFFSRITDNKIINQSTIEEALSDFNENQYSKLGSAIFALNPGEMNKNIGELFINGDMDKRVTTPLNAKNHLKHLTDYESNHALPCFFTSTPIDRRICRQSGNFTIHGSMVWPLDHQKVSRELIHKIFIPFKVFEEINTTLDALNINESSIYGFSEIDNIARNISNDAKNIFEKEINDLIEKHKTVPYLERDNANSFI
ncbi:FRG domain-containing protein [Lysinibacillus fusiformis]|uniref:FRG domain-containing protein n=1 Tax=Lysinibacillus fusiformis TaxID=28031 RepID=UPI0011A25B29|nr:FRG domain-containing protein [Lysinibacillus fusiformis]